MTNKRYEPINKAVPHMLHGADYNPEQWMHRPENIWDEDMAMMDIAKMNVVSIGIFSWSTLEPSEGVFDFEWLDKVMDMLAANGRYAMLATPTGARPAWMSAKYPEVLRVREDGLRNGHGVRHNHCASSPVYREKARIINKKLAERYHDHPALLGWHISNEYYGDCHCDLCKENFRDWLKGKYDTLDALNQGWWTKFWSHDYSDWSQIDPPTFHGESSIDGLEVDWKRFIVDLTVDFMKNEIAAVKEFSTDKPVTTNFHGMPYPTMNYWKFAVHLDVVSWDLYPDWAKLSEDSTVGSDTAFVYDIARALKGGRPFMLMESTPSTCWVVHKQQRPNIQMLSSMQAVAHGSDTVQYFQWRKGLGCCEKFHGAVVDHSGSSETKTFREVAEVGNILSQLDSVVGTVVEAEVAVIYDWENHWAIDKTVGLQDDDKKAYLEGCRSHHRAFWKKGIPVDVIDSEAPVDQYKIVVAPMLYMLKPDAIKNLNDFVNNGGTLVTTYWTGMVDENSLCFYGGFPGPLREVCGILNEENDGLLEKDSVKIRINKNQISTLKDQYLAHTACDVIHVETADVLAEYGSEYYEGMPALTRNNYGDGAAYHIAFRGEPAFLDDFYSEIAVEAGVQSVIKCDLPEGVTAQRRTDGEKDYIFLMNFSPDEKVVELGNGGLVDLLSGKPVKETLVMKAYEVDFYVR